eukprot:6492576-Amphidinium_carterae.1
MIAKLALWPITERWIEAEHAELKRCGSLKSVGPAFCSLSVRYATCMSGITSPHDFRQLCEHFEHLRSPRQIMKFFMLQGHPAVADSLLKHHLADTSQQSRHDVNRLRTAVGIALYLADGTTQWTQNRDNVKEMEELRAEAPGAWASQLLLQQQLSQPRRGFYDKMLELLFRQHVSQLQHEWFSLPSATLHEADILHEVEELLVAPLVDLEVPLDDVFAQKLLVCVPSTISSTFHRWVHGSFLCILYMLGLPVEVIEPIFQQKRCPSPFMLPVAAQVEDEEYNLEVRCCLPSTHHTSVSLDSHKYVGAVNQSPRPQVPFISHEKCSFTFAFVLALGGLCALLHLPPLQAAKPSRGVVAARAGLPPAFLYEAMEVIIACANMSENVLTSSGGTLSLLHTVNARNGL